MMIFPYIHITTVSFYGLQMKAKYLITKLALSMPVTLNMAASRLRRRTTFDTSITYHSVGIHYWFKHLYQSTILPWISHQRMQVQVTYRIVSQPASKQESANPAALVCQKLPSHAFSEPGKAEKLPEPPNPPKPRRSLPRQPRRRIQRLQLVFKVLRKLMAWNAQYTMALPLPILLYHPRLNGLLF